jgi:CHAD domain-containing protein
MPLEIEAKYEASAEMTLPPLDMLPGVGGQSGPVSEDLRAEYFDTADLRLLRSGITLRRRTGGHDAGWHLKLPVAPGSREEIRAPLGSTGRRVPAALANLVKARVRGERVRPVAVITTARQVVTLLGENGEPVAEVADDRVRAEPSPAGRGQAAEWREVEVELTGGGRELLDAADALFRQVGLLRSGRSAKLEKLLGELPADPSPILTAQSTAADVIRTYLRENASLLLALDAQVRRQAPDAVHRMRVAVRRMRSTLRSFDSTVGRGHSGGVAAELQWLGRVLGDERDAEVQARRLHGHVGATETEVLLGPVRARVQAHSAKTVATSHAAVMHALNSSRYVAFLDALDQLIADPMTGHEAEQAAAQVLPRAVRRSYRKTRRRMDAALGKPAGDTRDIAFHQARKSAKRARYAAEAAIPVCGKQAAKFARRMKGLQSVLGDHHDSVVGRREARQLGVSAHLAGESAFAYGIFYAVDDCRARQLDSAARKAWRHASRRKYRRWLA